MSDAHDQHGTDEHREAGHTNSQAPGDEHDHHGHGHDHGGHGHENDQGVRGMLRYLRWAPSMWRSDINTAVIDMVDAQAGETVVDVGAGMGAGAMAAARGGASVIAVEPTPFLRRVLTARRLLQRSRSRIEVADGSAEQLPVDDSSIDAIWAVNTMHHWVDVEQGVAEIDRTLRPGGRVVLVDEDFQDPTHPDHDRFGSDAEGEHHGFTMVDANQMGGLLSAVGLANVDASKRTIAGRPAIVVTATSPTLT